MEVNVLKSKSECVKMSEKEMNKKVSVNKRKKVSEKIKHKVNINCMSE